MTEIKTQILGEIETDIGVDIYSPQFTCPINGVEVLGGTSCRDCMGYEMCTADKESEVWQFKIN